MRKQKNHEFQDCRDAGVPGLRWGDVVQGLLERNVQNFITAKPGPAITDPFDGCAYARCRATPPGNYKDRR